MFSANSLSVELSIISMPKSSLQNFLIAAICNKKTSDGILYVIKMIPNFINYCFINEPTKNVYDTSFTGLQYVSLITASCNVQLISLVIFNPCSSSIVTSSSKSFLLKIFQSSEYSFVFDVSYFSGQ